MKRFILTIALLSSALVAGAQTSIEEVLRSVETNNKEDHNRDINEVSSNVRLAACSLSNCPPYSI